MINSCKTTIFVFALLVLAAGAHAANPRDELKQLVTQLQSNPSDTALREKIIKFAQTIKPAPTISEEARRSFIRGNGAFAAAKSTEEFDRAINLYRDASNYAPWWGNAYFNLAKALEQRQNYDGAIAALKLYLLAAPGAPDARATQDRIYSLEEQSERVSKEANAKAKADAAKAERRQWAAQIVQWLRTNYGGRLEKSINCGGPGRTIVKCTDAEAVGNNWYTLVSQVNSDSTDLRADNIRFSYANTGSDEETVQIRFQYNTVCGSVGGGNVESVNWAYCDNPSSPVRLAFLRRTGDSKGVIEIVSNCEGDLCVREQYTLEN